MPPERRILALSGGGVRGIVEVAFLEAVEVAYREKYGQQTRLCDVFDLVGGTSTGALIATALALGQPMSQIKDFYLNRASGFFQARRWWRFGRAPVLDCAGLEAEFRKDVGDLTLGDEALQTYLAIVTKRLDTGSAWIVNNIPTAPYYDDAADGSYRGNRHFELAKLLRATTSAPTLFSPQTISMGPGQVQGIFVDGGLTPYNDPSLALLQLARMQAFGLCWQPGPDALFVLSVGAGRFRTRMPANKGLINPLWLAYHAMRGAISDADQHSLMMMEWMGASQAPSRINSEVPHLADETPHDAPMFRYLRLDLPLEDALPGIASAAELKRLQSMDDPSVIQPLYDIAKAYVATWDLDRLLV